MEKSQNPKLGPASDFVTTDPTKCVKIYSNNKDDEFLTIPEVFARTVDSYPNRTAVMYKDELTGIWMSVTYREYKNRVEQVAKAFLSLGLERKGRVAILAFNSIEWFISAMSAVHAGGQFIGIYNTNSSDICFYILEKSRANIVVVDDDVQLEKIVKIRSKLPHLKAIIQTLPTSKNYEKIIKWNDLEKMDVASYDKTYQKNLMEITANSCAAILFTSGTTGNPKGALLSHDNVLDNAKKVTKIWNINRTRTPEVFVSYLPLSHLAGIIIDVFTTANVAATIYIADRNALKGTLINTLLVARPTSFFAVPRVWEKIYEKIYPEIQNLNGVKKILLKWAQESAIKFNQNRMSGGTSNFQISYFLARNFVLNKLKTRIGLDRVRNITCGSAPLNIDVCKFFLSLDLTINDIYGMTESGITTGDESNIIKLGGVGRAAHGVDIRIENPDLKKIGEIITRSRSNFMGYLDDMEKTREILDAENWIHSGDLGYIDGDGFLYITGRIKELIITAGGENIPFLNIESAVKSECLAISNAFLIGDKRKFLSILITLKTKVDVNGAPTDELAGETLNVLQSLGLNFKSMSEVIKSGPDEKILNHFHEVVIRANKKAISSAQKVQKFIILPNDFSIATGELGPTMKLKRNFVIEKYKKDIDQLYA